MVFFRVTSIRTALRMVRKIFTDLDPWVLFDGSLYGYGLDNRNFILLVIGVMVIAAIELVQFKRPAYITERFHRQPVWFRYGFLMLGIFSVIIFGVYGMGYDASEFIYGQF